MKKIYLFICAVLTLISLTGCVVMNPEDFESCGYPLPGGFMLYTDGYPDPDWNDRHFVMPMEDWISFAKDMVRDVTRLDWNEEYIAVESSLEPISESDYEEHFGDYYKQDYRFYIIEVESGKFVCKTDDEEEFLRRAREFFNDGVELKSPKDQAARALE